VIELLINIIETLRIVVVESSAPRSLKSRVDTRLRHNNALLQMHMTNS